MGSPFIGEIRMFAGNFAPTGWAFCDGSLLAISEENNALFALIGTTYGGDGKTTFQLPDLQGRIPIHQGSSGQGGSHGIGESAGSEAVTLTVNETPAHVHPIISNSAATGGEPLNTFIGAPATAKIYGPNAAINPTAMSPSAMPSRGGSQPHENLMPYLCVTFIISLSGIFPSQS